jgi:hypothetical protein
MFGRTTDEIIGCTDADI